MSKITILFTTVGWKPYPDDADEKRARQTRYSEKGETVDVPSSEAKRLIGLGAATSGDEDVMGGAFAAEPLRHVESQAPGKVAPADPNVKNDADLQEQNAEENEAAAEQAAEARKAADEQVAAEKKAAAQADASAKKAAGETGKGAGKRGKRAAARAARSKT